MVEIGFDQFGIWLDRSGIGLDWFGLVLISFDRFGVGLVWFGKVWDMFDRFGLVWLGLG